MTELNVKLYGQRIGTLTGIRDKFDFVADADMVRRYGRGSTILSLALPLVTSPRADGLAARRNFFEEILAEGTARTRLADIARLDDSNTMALLRRYGRDVAGAVQIWDPTDPDEPRTPSMAPIGVARVRELLTEVKRAPIGNTSARRMSLLAGVQDKIVLARFDDEWAEPLDGYPSTHILKPVVAALPSVIFDEEYGARIARHLGLANFDTHIEQFDGVSALVIERYDRGPEGRIHQEDFNQALGLRGDAKYEVNGNPGLIAIANLLRGSVGRRAVEDLLRMTTLSIVVGNLDMHAKNVSILHLPDGMTQLAPMYDVVPQVHQPFDKDFAFAINGIYAHSGITRDSLEAEGRGWGLRNAGAIVDRTLEQVAEFVAEERPLPGAHHALASDITRFCRNLLDGRGASAAERSIERAEGGTPRRKDRDVGQTANGRTGGSFAEKQHSKPETKLAGMREADGGWGGPVR